MDEEKTAVLLIEDNPGDARLIQEYISESGSDIFRLEHVSHLSLGLERLVRGDIGIILLDLTLPDSQGLEGLLKILAKTPDVPVVVLSGMKDETIAIQAVHEGAQDYLVKGSIDGTLLVRMLRHAIKRHRLRVALQESESRYRLLAENIADVVWVADEKGRITYVSPSVKPLLGYTSEELEKHRIRDILTPDSAEQARRFVQNQIELGVLQSRSSPLTLTLEHVRKDGSTVWAEVMLSFLLDKKGHFSGIMGATRDITARKRAEEALQRSEEHFRALIENASDAVVILDSKGIVCYESPSVERVLGNKVVDRIGQSAFEFVHPQDRPNVDKAFGELLQQTDATVSTEFRIRNKDGSWRFIDGVGRNLLHNPAIAGVVVNFRDVTKRKEAEQALRESEEELQAIFDGTRDGMALLDLEGKIIRVNKRILAIGGYSEEEVIGNIVESLKMFTAQSLQEMGSVKELFFSGQEVPPFELEVFTKTGEKLILEVYLTPLKKGGETIGSIAVARNITDRRKAEEAHRESETRFRTVFEGTNVAMALIDKRGKPLSVNPAFSRMFGYGFEKFCSLNRLKYLYPDDAMVDSGLYLELLDGKRDHYTVDKRYIKNSGEVLWGRQNLSVVRNAEGKPEYFIAMIEDITERRNMVEALRKSEERYRELFENANDIIYMHDINGNFTAINRAAELVTGYSRDEVLAMNIAQILPAESLKLAREMIAVKVKEGSRTQYEIEIIAKDGHRVLLEVSTRVIYQNDQPVGVQGIARDITERKTMEHALHQREQDYLILLESTQEGMFVVDAETLKVVYGNRRASMMFGFDPELQDGIGVNILDLVHPDDRETVIRGFVEDLPKLERRKRYEVRASTKDGREILVSALGTRIEFRGRLSVLLSAKDITEQRKAEEALRLSERDYKVLFESTLDGLVVLDAETMKIVLANQTAAKLVEIDSADTLIGLDPFEFLPVENRDKVRNIVREDVFEKDLHRIHEYRLSPVNGEERWVSAVSTRTEYRGRMAALISIRDITERKKAEGEKQKMEEQLRLAGRLAAVGELAAGVAHELNNPIAAMQGFAQLLAAKKDVDESVKKDLDVIYREAQRAGKITKNLLSFARRHEPEKRFISINEALEKTLELHTHQMKMHNIELEVVLDQNLPRTMADFNLMQQIFVNIINNAEQAMFDAHGKGKLIIRTRKYGEMIQIIFTDDGPGIAEENLGSIFDPFFTTKGVGKGTGLGLSICYGLVEAHNGRIYARSMLGEGATFIVDIPIIPEERPAAEAVFIKSKKESAKWRK